MPIQVPMVGIAQYNGITFSAAAETLEFRAFPQYDPANRTVSHTIFTLTLRDWVTGRPSDPQVQAMFSALLIPSAGLLFNGRGFGGIDINRGGKRDMVWGPKPRMVQLKPLGASNAVRFDWQVEFATLNCGDADTTPGGLMEFTYRLTFDVDKSGYTKRTYRATARVANSRNVVQDRIVRVSADEWRERINPPLVDGFARTPGVAELSEDKSTVTVTVVDEELPPNVPPPGVVRCSASHDFSTPKLMTKVWTGTFSAEYEVARGAPVSNAYRAAFATLQDRLTVHRAIQPSPTVIPMQVTVRESNLYDKTKVSLSLSYSLVTASLPDIIAAGGLWRLVPKPFNTWKAWVQSIPQVFDPRGLAELQFRPGDDAIIDLCGKTPTITDMGTNRAPPIDTDLKTGRPPQIDTELKRAFPPPTPDTSYLRYLNAIRVENDQGNVVVRVLPTEPLGEGRLTSGVWDAELSTLPRGRENTPFPPASDVGFARGGRLDSQSAGAQVQQRVSPQLYFYLVGEAVRAGYPIPVPELLTINGRDAICVNRPDAEFFVQGIVGTGGTVPIYGATWCLRYTCELPPAGALPVPPNPLLGS